jgi:hypothetical protein
MFMVVAQDKEKINSSLILLMKEVLSFVIALKIIKGKITLSGF